MASVRVIWTGFCPFAVTALSAVSFHVTTAHLQETIPGKRRRRTPVPMVMATLVVSMLWFYPPMIEAGALNEPRPE
jgi:hypothetical protein